MLSDEVSKKTTMKQRKKRILSHATRTHKKDSPQRRHTGLDDKEAIPPGPNGVGSSSGKSDE